MTAANFVALIATIIAAFVTRDTQAQQCGQRSSNIGNFGPYIVGGQNAVPGAWPWQAMVLAYNTSVSPGDDVQCPPSCYRTLCRGGSLLNERWVLTAAHCTYYDNGTEIQTTAFIIKLGTTANLPQTDSNTKTFGVDRIVRYPNFDVANITMYHDIALLRLNEPVQYNDYIRPICLPSAGVDITKYKVCVATGWGALNATSTNVPQSLQQVVAQFPSPVTCYNARGYNDDYQLCMNASQCLGDGGTPTVCQDDSNTWSVVGIGSMSDPGCSRISIDCRVSTYTDWVQQTIVLPPTTTQTTTTALPSSTPLLIVEPAADSQHAGVSQPMIIALAAGIGGAFLIILLVILATVLCVKLMRKKNGDAVKTKFPESDIKPGKENVYEGISVISDSKQSVVTGKTSTDSDNSYEKLRQEICITLSPNDYQMLSKQKK